MRNYERQKIEQFGRQLITTGDLDPVYIALRRAEFDEGQLRRWLVAYWCLYHCGVASYISQFEGREFWQKLSEAARNETQTPIGTRWPRGSERRHWRGQQAVSSCNALWTRYGDEPEQMVDYIAQPAAAPLTFQQVSARAQEHRGFGDWIGFKVADMVDRVIGVPVAFDEAAVFMFKDPEKAALMLWEQREGGQYEGKVRPKREVILHGVTEHLIKEFSDLPAPPLGDRPINIQEVETVLCKWKSHCNGHYPPGNDIREISHGLQEWTAASTAAEQFLAAMPRLP